MYNFYKTIYYKLSRYRDGKESIMSKEKNTNNAAAEFSVSIPAVNAFVAAAINAADSEWNKAYLCGRAFAGATKKDAREKVDAAIDAAFKSRGRAVDTVTRSTRSKYARVYMFGKLADDAPHFSAYPFNSVSALFEAIAGLHITTKTSDADAAAALDKFVKDAAITPAVGALKIRNILKEANAADAPAEKAAPAADAPANSDGAVIATFKKAIHDGDVYAACRRLRLTLTTQDAVDAFHVLTSIICPTFGAAFAAEKAAAAANIGTLEKDADDARAAFVAAFDKYTRARAAFVAAENSARIASEVLADARAAVADAEHANSVALYKEAIDAEKAAAAVAEKCASDAANAGKARNDAEKAAADAGDVYDAAAEKVAAARLFVR